MTHTYGVWRLVAQGLYGNLAVGGSDIFSCPWPSRGCVPQPQGLRWQRQDFREKDRGDKEKTISCRLSKLPGCWLLTLLLVSHWPELKHMAPLSCQGGWGTWSLFGGGPVCPVTNSITLGKEAIESWDMSNNFRTTTMSPLLIAHYLVQSRDSFHYLFNQL